MKKGNQSAKSLAVKIISAVVVLVISVFGGKEILSDKPDSDTSGSSSYSQSSQVEESSKDEEPESSFESQTEKSESSSSSSSSSVSESSEESYDSEAEEQLYYFASDYLLDSHFEKHGHEFDGQYATAEEYEAGANRVINSPDALYKTEKEDGDHIYYIEETNEFVVVSTSGSIRTYFKPTDGIDYFNRQ